MQRFTLLMFCMIPFWMMAQEAAVPCEFSHTEQTSASPASIWSWWTDVARWQEWDTGLQKATLADDAPGPGVRGKLIPDRGPKAAFQFSDWQEGEGYAFSTKLPFARLIVSRQVTTADGHTQFTHRVSFTGPLRRFWAKRLGTRYEQMLPDVMNNLKQLAER